MCLAQSFLFLTVLFHHNPTGRIPKFIRILVRERPPTATVADVFRDVEKQSQIPLDDHVRAWIQQNLTSDPEDPMLDGSVEESDGDGEEDGEATVLHMPSVSEAAGPIRISCQPSLPMPPPQFAKPAPLRLTSATPPRLPPVASRSEAAASGTHVSLNSTTRMPVGLVSDAIAEQVLHQREGHELLLKIVDRQATMHENITRQQLLVDEKRFSLIPPKQRVPWLRAEKVCRCA